MLDREYPSHLRTRLWWFLTILSVIILACASCSDATKPPSHSRQATMQPAHVIEATRLPLTDSAPPQLDVTPTVPVPTPTPLSVPAITTPTPPPRVLQTTTIDDSAEGTGLNQFNYAGSGWYYCTNCGSDLYNGTNTWDNTPNSYVTLIFTGIQIRFYTVLDPKHGIGAVSLDGGSETMIDCYAPVRAGDQLQWTSPTLPTGTHTFKLRVTGTKIPAVLITTWQLIVSISGAKTHWSDIDRIVV